MRRAFFVLFLLTCTLAYGQSPPAKKAPAEDSIKSTIRNRQKRSIKRAYAVKNKQVLRENQAQADAKTAESMRARQMENERHAATMQHAVNGQNANAIQAERNRVMLEQARALNRLAGTPVCSNCGALGHFACARVSKSPAVLEYEAMVGQMIPR